MESYFSLYPSNQNAIKYWIEDNCETASDQELKAEMNKLTDEVVTIFKNMKAFHEELKAKKKLKVDFLETSKELADGFKTYESQWKPENIVEKIIPLDKYDIDYLYNATFDVLLNGFKYNYQVSTFAQARDSYNPIYHVHILSAKTFNAIFVHREIELENEHVLVKNTPSKFHSLLKKLLMETKFEGLDIESEDNITKYYLVVLPKEDKQDPDPKELKMILGSMLGKTFQSKLRKFPVYQQFEETLANEEGKVTLDYQKFTGDVDVYHPILIKKGKSFVCLESSVIKGAKSPSPKKDSPKMAKPGSPKAGPSSSPKVVSVTNKTFVFSGYRDKKAEEKITKAGGFVRTAVSGKTDYLVTDNINASNDKMQKAKEKKVTIITKEAFEKVLASL